MKQVTTTILLAAVVLVSFSCKKDLVGDGPITTEIRSVPSFTGIDLRMNGYVYYTKSAETKLEITAKETIHSMLETSVQNGKLVIRYSNGKTYDADESIRINVSGPDLNSLQLNTSGSIICLSDIQTQDLYLRSTGSGSISLKRVAANSIDAASNQSGHITATGGSTVSEKLKTDGSGRIDLSAVAAKSANTHIVGSGDIKVRVSDYLYADIDGSGSVYFTGSPSLSTHISGTGNLIRF